MVVFSAAARKLGMEDNQVKAIYNAAINHLKNVKELAEYKYFIHSRKDASGESGSSADSEPELKTNGGTLSRVTIDYNENIISAINDEMIQVAVVSFPDVLPDDNEFTTPVTSIN